MSLPEPLARITQALDRAGIPYMVVGSFASIFYGEPRTTVDLDVVIDPDRDAMQRFITEIQAEGYYADAQTAGEALERRTQFNVIDPDSGWKADLVVRKERPFSAFEFERRQASDSLGYVATAEDTILAKLEWARAGDSERQLRDVRSILAVSGDRLDIPYIERWADELDVSDLWHEVRANDRT